MKRAVSPHILLLSAVVLAGFTGCTKTGQPGGTVVEIRAAVDGTAVETKAASPLPGGSSFGIFACVHEDAPAVFAPFKPATYNVRANGGGDAWTFDYVFYTSTGGLGGGNSSSSFRLVARDDDQAADLYAYAPWTQDAHATGPAAIPFVSSENRDLMYAEQNLTNANGGKDPANPPLSAAFTFKHAMARLDLKLRLRNGPPTVYKISEVTVRRADGASTCLYTSGSLNAITGELDPLEEGESFSVAFPPEFTLVDSTTPRTLTILLPPTDLAADGELEIVITANGQQLRAFPIKQEYVEYDGGSSHGFRAGYRYTFNFTLDNYLFLDGFTLSDSWTPEDLVPEEI